MPETAPTTPHRGPEPDFDRLHLDVAFGRAGGKVIWQPRIECWYGDKRRAGVPLPAPYTGMSLPELYRALGVSARIYAFNRCFVAAEDPAVRYRERQITETDVERVWETPVGTQTAVERRRPDVSYAKHLKWPIADEADMRVATWRKAHETWRFDEATFRRVRAEWAGLGAPTLYLPRVNVQRLYIDDMGVEAGIFALMDHPDACAAYFEALEGSTERLIGVVCDSPVQIINFGDNIHAATLPPDLFRRHVLPVYRRRSERLHAAGRFVHAHWDGDTGPLLPFARETGLDGIEAITPRPQGDVTLEAVKEALGDMFLLDGIPAIYFDTTYDEQVLVDGARQVIDLFAPNLILGISDEISSTGEIERVRLVSDVVNAYNATL